MQDRDRDKDGRSHRVKVYESNWQFKFHAIVSTDLLLWVLLLWPKAVKFPKSVYSLFLPDLKKYVEK